MDFSKYPITITTAQIKDSPDKRYVTDKQLASIAGPAAQMGGDLQGFFPNPKLKNASVLSQKLTGFIASAGLIDANDTILSAIQKIVGNIVFPIYVAQEIPTGAIDGTNKVFTLAFPTILNSEMIFQQGLLKFRTIDYSIVGNTITFVTAPSVSDDVRVTYIH